MNRRKPEPDTFRSIGEIAEPIIDRIAQKRIEQRTHSYDPACETLAEHFLSDERHGPNDLRDLSQEIQDTVESWFRARDRKLEDQAL